MVFDAHDKAFAFFGGACARGIHDSGNCPVGHCGAIGPSPMVDGPRTMDECSRIDAVPMPGRTGTPTLRTRRSGTSSKKSAGALYPMSAHVRWLPCRRAIVRHWFKNNGERLRLRRPASCASTRTVTPWTPASRRRRACGTTGRPVEIRACADRLECWQDSQIVGRHDRAFGRGKTIYDPLHYIPVLARKPGALRSEPRGRHRFETRGERAVQGVGSAIGPAPCATQARTTARRRPPDGRHPRGRAHRWHGRRRSCLCGGPVSQCPFRRRRSEHPGATSRQRRASSTTSRRHR